MIQVAIEQALRNERVTLLAALFRVSKDFDLAEEALQEATTRALLHWASSGVPEKPGAWLFVVGKRWLLDQRRTEARARVLNAPEISEVDEPGDMAGSREDQLRLIFLCCGSDLPERTRVGLALRSLVGLSTKEIARAFVESEKATAQRLVRAKRLLKASAHDQMPEGDERQKAIDAVHRVVYLLYNEGYLASGGDQLIRANVADDAIALGLMLCDLLPFHAETLGLVSMMLFHASRSEARVDADGGLIPLEEQDRSRWNRELIQKGTAIANRMVELHRAGGATTGPYQLQAAIAALHCNAARAADTDWLQIAALYRRLVQISPTPVNELNAAVALAMSGKLSEGLSWVNHLEKGRALEGYHLLYAVKAGLLHRMGHWSQAKRYYARARKLAGNALEKRYLSRRISEVLASQRSRSND